MQDFKLPFQLLLDKFPILGFVWRTLTFPIFPFMPKGELKSTGLSYAYVDIAFSFTVALIIIALLPADVGLVSFRQILKAFNFEWIIASYLCYSFLQALTVFICYALFFCRRAQSDTWILDAYYSSLQFLRIHSIVILLSILGFFYILYSHLNYGVLPHYFEVHFSQLNVAKSLSVGFLAMGVWLYIIPMSLFIYRRSKRKSLFRYVKGILVSFLIYSVSFIPSSYIDLPFIHWIFNQDGYCEVLDKSPIKRLSPNAYNKSEWAKKCT